LLKTSSTGTIFTFSGSLLTITTSRFFAERCLRMAAFTSARVSLAYWARDVTALDLTPRLDWTQNVVAATIAGTKPKLTSFYDGGDWDNLPASPLDAAMQGFLQYQPNHTAAPFARKLVQGLGQTPASSGTVTDYRSSFPLSYFGQAAPF